MKLTVGIFCFFTLAAAFAAAELSPQAMEKLQNAMETCKPKTGATDEDIEILMKHEVPDTKTGQCFVACMNKELKLVTADNKFDIEHIKKISEPLKEKDAEKYEKGIKVVETCIGEATKESDECTIAKVMMECTKKEAAASGIMSAATS